MQYEVFPICLLGRCNSSGPCELLVFFSLIVLHLFYFPQTQAISHLCTHLCTTEDSRVWDFRQNSRTRSVHLFSLLLCSVNVTCPLVSEYNKIPAPCPQCRETTGLLRVSPSCTAAWKLSPGIMLSQLQVSPHSRIIALHNLIYNHKNYSFIYFVQFSVASSKV